MVGEASQDPTEDDAFEKWEPPILHEGRPISASDSVVASQDFAFDLTKFLLLPVDMADHNGPRDIPILKGTLQMMTAVSVFFALLNFAVALLSSFFLSSLSSFAVYPENAHVHYPC